jgi:hypothetical protein
MYVCMHVYMMRMRRFMTNSAETLYMYMSLELIQLLKTHVRALTYEYVGVCTCMCVYTCMHEPILAHKRAYINTYSYKAL